MLPEVQREAGPVLLGRQDVQGRAGRALRAARYTVVLIILLQVRYYRLFCCYVCQNVQFLYTYDDYEGCPRPELVFLVGVEHLAQLVCSLSRY